MRISVAYEFLPKRPSVHAAMAMDHFGIGFDAGRHVIAEDLELPIQPGDVVLFTGPSGSGKSSLLRGVANGLQETPQSDSPATPNASQGPGSAAAVVNVDAIELDERILVDGLNLPAGEAFALLTSCGLGEARVMLRTPGELSDGQRYRFRLARAMSLSPQWLLADEFTATLDRTLAKIVAFNLARTARQRGIGLLLATTHDDVAADLHPDLHVRCGLDGAIDLASGGEAEGTTEGPAERVKKKPSALPGRSSLRPARSAIGRTSLGGIIGATGWDS